MFVSKFPLNGVFVVLLAWDGMGWIGLKLGLGLGMAFSFFFELSHYNGSHTVFVT